MATRGGDEARPKRGESPGNGGQTSSPAMHFFWQHVKRTLTHSHTENLRPTRILSLPRSHAHRVVYVIYQVYACWPGKVSDVSVCEWSWKRQCCQLHCRAAIDYNPRPEGTPPSSQPGGQRRVLFGGSALAAGRPATGRPITNHNGACAHYPIPAVRRTRSTASRTSAGDPKPIANLLDFMPKVSYIISSFLV